MILNNRLLTAFLAVLLSGAALTGLATAQGPVETACDGIPGPDLVPCEETAAVDDALAGAPDPTAVLDCLGPSPPAVVACLSALPGEPPVGESDVCAALAPLGAASDDLATCLDEVAAAAENVPDADETVCGATTAGGETADECLGNELDARQAALIAAAAAVTAPAIGTVAISDTTPTVGQQVTVTAPFTTFLTRLPGPAAGLSTNQSTPVQAAVAALDDVSGSASGVAGASVTVNNLAHTLAATFTPSAAGPATLTITLTYSNDTLNALAGGPLDAFVSDAADALVNAFVPNQAPNAVAGDQTVTEFDLVTLSGAASSDPDNGPQPLSFAWTQLSGTTVALSGAGTSAATFTAPEVSGAPQSLVFRLTVSDGDLSDMDDVTIMVKSATSVGEVTTADPDAVLSLDAGDFAGPIAGVASDTTVTAILHDLNGVDTLDNGLLSSSLTGPQGLDETLGFTSATDSAPEGDTDTQRDFLYDLSFPERLQDGAYQFATTYGGSSPVTHDFVVANVAPTLAADAVVTHEFIAGHGAFVTDPVTLTLDDANWGGFAGTDVTELQDLTLSGVLTGLVLQVSTDGDTWTDVAGLSHDLSAVANDGSGAQELLVRLASPDGFVDQGVAVVVTAVLSDQSAAESLPVPLFTLTIRPENYGFFFGVDDGGDGISIGSGSVVPGTRNDSGADPVAVAFTGTFDADALVVSIGRFTCVSAGCDDSFGAYNSDAAKNGIVKLYGTPDLSDVPVQLPVGSAGSAGFDLTGLPLGVAGSTLYVVLDLYVPAGLDAGTYVGTVNIDATGDEA
jgi:hypothetical protein